MRSAWVLVELGCVVFAVDLRGINCADPMTVPGAVLLWDRVGDLEAALERVKADPVIGPHLDLHRLGAAGFASGGLNALMATGARAAPARFQAFCTAHPDDGMCRPQPEFPVTAAQAAEALATPDLAADAARAGQDRSIRGVSAVFAIAPAFVQALDPACLTAIDTPVAIVLGQADTVAAPNTNGGAAARAIPRAQLTILPGVGHYDFVSACSPEGRANLTICQVALPQGPTHVRTLEAALAFFGKTLGRP